MVLTEKVMETEISGQTMVVQVWVVMRNWLGNS